MWCAPSRPAPPAAHADPHRAPQDRMHLDCVFSILGDDCCIMLEDIMGDGSPTRRLVDEYMRDPATHKYKLARWAALASPPRGASWPGTGRGRGLVRGGGGGGTVQLPATQHRHTTAWGAICLYAWLTMQQVIGPPELVVSRVPVLFSGCNWAMPHARSL